MRSEFYGPGQAGPYRCIHSSGGEMSTSIHSASVKPPLWFWVVAALMLLMPAMVLTLSLFLVWFAHRARGRGWLR
jgi:hypothetical protein